MYIFVQHVRDVHVCIRLGVCAACSRDRACMSQYARSSKRSSGTVIVPMHSCSRQCNPANLCIDTLTLEVPQQPSHCVCRAVAHHRAEFVAFFNPRFLGLCVLGIISFCCRKRKFQIDEVLGCCETVPNRLETFLYIGSPMVEFINAVYEVIQRCAPHIMRLLQSVHCRILPNVI